MPSEPPIPAFGGHPSFYTWDLKWRCYVCDLCRRFVTDDHLQTSRHIRRMMERTSSITQQSLPTGSNTPPRHHDTETYGCAWDRYCKQGLSAYCAYNGDECSSARDARANEHHGTGTSTNKMAPISKVFVPNPSEDIETFECTNRWIHLSEFDRESVQQLAATSEEMYSAVKYMAEYLREVNYSEDHMKAWPNKSVEALRDDADRRDREHKKKNQCVSS